jgi:hypothetical protein
MFQSRFATPAPCSGAPVPSASLPLSRCGPCPAPALGRTCKSPTSCPTTTSAAWRRLTRRNRRCCATGTTAQSKTSRSAGRGPRGVVVVGRSTATSGTAGATTCCAVSLDGSCTSGLKTMLTVRSDMAVARRGAIRVNSIEQMVRESKPSLSRGLADGTYPLATRPRPDSKHTQGIQLWSHFSYTNLRQQHLS